MVDWDWVPLAEAEKRDMEVISPDVSRRNDMVREFDWLLVVGNAEDFGRSLEEVRCSPMQQVAQSLTVSFSHAPFGPTILSPSLYNF